jgi:hypothetical protein
MEEYGRIWKYVEVYGNMEVDGNMEVQHNMEIWKYGMGGDRHYTHTTLL